MINIVMCTSFVSPYTRVVHKFLRCLYSTYIYILRSTEITKVIYHICNLIALEALFHIFY
jgi:hypothetical protein